MVNLQLPREDSACLTQAGAAWLLSTRRCGWVSAHARDLRLRARSLVACRPRILGRISLYVLSEVRAILTLLR